MSAVNYETGEIVEPGTDLAPVDKSSAASVITYLDRARTWLATAVEVTGPAEIAMAKAQIATAAEATKQLNLSKEIQLDAQEMVRRAEYTLGKAIRKGQEEGTVAKPGGLGPVHTPGLRGSSPRTGAQLDDAPLSPKALGVDNHAAGEIYGMSDGVEPAQFDAALEQAKAEGNLSRANVVRKVKGQKSEGRMTRAEKAEVLADLAAQGYSSRQMCKQLEFSRDDMVRELAREYGIEIPADKAISRTRRHNSHRIASETVAALDGLAMGVDLIDYDDLDSGEIGHWVDSLNHSLRVLNRFHKRLKETTQ